MYRCVGVLFADLFRELESDDGVLSSLDEVDLFCLHTTFLEGYDTAGNLVRNCEKSVRNHGNLPRYQKSGP